MEFQAQTDQPGLRAARWKFAGLVLALIAAPFAINFPAILSTADQIMTAHELLSISLPSGLLIAGIVAYLKHRQSSIRQAFRMNDRPIGGIAFAFPVGLIFLEIILGANINASNVLILLCMAFPFVLGMLYLLSPRFTNATHTGFSEYRVVRIGLAMSVQATRLLSAALIIMLALSHASSYFPTFFFLPSKSLSIALSSLQFLFAVGLIMFQRVSREQEGQTSQGQQLALEWLAVIVFVYSLGVSAVWGYRYSARFHDIEGPVKVISWRIWSAWWFLFSLALLRLAGERGRGVVSAPKRESSQ